MKTVFVIGAGPAGLYATQKIAKAGHQVVILNRDIKPGGLAEYGIYPAKEKMKGGLRKQFAKFLEQPNVAYFGHLPVGKTYALPMEALKEWNPAAMVFSVGAQGTKKLGLPGENAKGVYSAKDFVFFYNQLPPFATMDFSTGKRVAIVGMGNVMVDIARWLLEDDPLHTVEEVTVIARRGPFEAKFDEKEFHYIDRHLDRAALDDELHRIKHKLDVIGEDIEKLKDATFPILGTPVHPPEGARLKFRFLCSPAAIHADRDGRIARLTVAENILVEKNGSLAAKATDETTDLEFDTMIFAIGDVADPTVGLPFAKDGYVTNPDESRGEQHAYEVFDPASGKVIEGTYVVGWARKASDGLVGVAKFDAEKGAEHILRYLDGVTDGATPGIDEFAGKLARAGLEFVSKKDLEYLGQAEAARAAAMGLVSFKFATDSEMLNAIASQRIKAPSLKEP